MAPRRSRIPEAETTRRMLDAAADIVSRDGMSVGLRLRMEDVIDAAGVSRAAAYRRWPHRDDLVLDVLRHIAAAPDMPTVSADDVRRLVRRVARRHDRRGGELDRHGAAVELSTEAATLEFDELLGSAAWRRYVLLAAAVDALPNDSDRAAIRADLERSDTGQLARVARVYHLIADVLGLTTADDVDVPEFARVTTVLVRGLVARAAQSGDSTVSKVARQDLGIGVQALFDRYFVVDRSVETVRSDWARVLSTSLGEHMTHG